MNKEYSPENVYTIASEIQSHLEDSIAEIDDVYERAHVLSINARIEAARSGNNGAGFRIVANEFSEMNNEIRSISKSLSENINSKSKTLMSVSNGMAKQVRGQRLSQVALSIMDVIDRNLYERTCDVRWWATDSSLSTLVQDKNNKNIQHATKRLGEILDSYTVYLDLVCVDLEGNILANGRPERYNSCRTPVNNHKWYVDSLSLQNKDQYSFQGMHSSNIVDNEQVLIYGCKVYNDAGVENGVLGILFNWNALVKAVMDRVLGIDLYNDINVFRLATTIMIIDQSGTIISSSDNNIGEKYDSNSLNIILSSKSTGHTIVNNNSDFKIIAYGYSPGFETYSTGWYCIIEQTLVSTF